MWKSIVSAWLNVKSSLTKSDPTTSAEIFRQPNFGNPSILNSRGTPLERSGLSEGCAFAQFGGSGVATPLWPSVGLKPNTWKSWGFGVPLGLPNV
jgi:hypothetical protein